MSRLIKKELVLSMHPITPLMLALSSMVLIPNYPYLVIFFYLTLALFFTCMLGRENQDVIYTMTLPVAKCEIVKARIGAAVLLELCQLLLILPFSWLRQKMLPVGNAAGMDANLVLLAEGLLLFGVFHLVFFCSYYRNVDRVGISFIRATAAVFLLAAADVIASYAIPFVRDYLDTPDPQFLGYKLAVLGVSALLYLGMTALACRISIRRFEKLDL